MATVKQILHKKNSSGGYDTVYLRTRADNVLMTDNSTLLSSKISAMDTTIAGKAASNHSHSGYAASNHTHQVSQITGLSTSPIVVLASGTGTAGSQSFSINTSGMNLSQYRELRLFCENVKCSGADSNLSNYNWLGIRFNNDSTDGNYKGKNFNNHIQTAMFYVEKSDIPKTITIEVRIKSHNASSRNYTLVDTAYAFGTDETNALADYHTYEMDDSTNRAQPGWWTKGNFSNITSINCHMMGWGTSSSVLKNYTFVNAVPYKLYGLI